jgi:hypothetical protein
MVATCTYRKVYVVDAWEKEMVVLADLLFSARTSSMRRQYWVLGSSPLIPSLGLGNIRLEQRII